MTNGIGIRPNVLESRERWKSSLVDIRKLHDQGASGRETCHLISDLLDSILKKIYEKALAEISPGLASRISLVLLGGCGRRDVAPFSDVDLMVLYQGSLTDDIVEFSRRISQDITDSGFQLGYSVRTPRDACSMRVATMKFLNNRLRKC